MQTQPQPRSRKTKTSTKPKADAVGLAPASPVFTLETLKFLRGLARNNDREWFEPRRDVYERALKGPLLAFVAEINARMGAFAPTHVRPPEKTAMRLYRDTRFSPDKSPYKKHIAAWWAERGTVRTTGAGFYFSLSPDEITVAAGVYMPEREQLLAIRRWLAEHHVAYRRVLSKVVSGKDSLRFVPSEAQALQRTPKGFAPDGPADDLLRATTWAVHVSLDPKASLEPGFAALVAARFARAAPLVLSLSEAMRGSQAGEQNAFHTAFSL